MISLSPVEVRVLACLVEKETTTPEYYPLTINGLRNACNQKSSREPVMTLDEMQITQAVTRMRTMGIMSERSEPGNRSAKYIHYFENLVPCTPAEKAALCVLMLRGEQTTGEIKNRSGRLYEFKSPAEVEAVLQGLMTRAEPLVEKLPRETGTKERRYRHLFCSAAATGSAESTSSGETDSPLNSSSAPIGSSGGAAVPDERFVALEKQVASLRQEVESVKTRLVQLIEVMRNSDDKAGS